MDADDKDAIHCRDLVRAEDKDRFLSSLFAPADKRADLMALYAFDIEVSRIRFLVSEPGLGEIRLQWWADSIEAIFGGSVGDHPVVRALGHAIETAACPSNRCST